MTGVIPPAPDTITVMLPVKHYHDRFLLEAVESVFAQSSDRWLLLVIVHPEAEAPLRALLAGPLLDPRVSFVRGTGEGLGAAFNTGMRAARTEFVSILLGDDLWEPRAIAAVQEAMAEHPEVDFFHSARRIVSDDLTPISSVYGAQESFEPGDFVFRSPVKHLLCWRRSLALSFGGMDESLANVGVDDHDFPWLMADHGARFQAIQECLYVYRDHREGYRLTTHIPRSVHLREQRRVLEKHGVAEPLIRKRLRDAKRGYLRECLYRNELHARLWQWLGIGPSAPWRQQYR
ncbi:MAG: glycosyl transferase family 2 [Gemmatimonadetes bacterium]|nr:glycosyl transferase family 2 [Gemmatimonadota bacterium]